MSSSNFPADRSSRLVADASVAINLNATGCAVQILHALPHRVAVTANALAELKSGLYKGYQDAEHLQKLIDDDLVELVPLNDRGLEIYGTLIEGSETLDDGEAATIALAVQVRGVPILDERRARRICVTRFTAQAIISTVDLLMHDAVLASLGASSRLEAIVSALKKGRMHVPKDRIDDIVALLGDKAIECPSLPKKSRLR